MKRAMAAIYVGTDGIPFIISETPSEAAAIVQKAHSEGQVFAELTLGNQSEWNAKPLYVRPASVVAISPPKSDPDQE